MRTSVRLLCALAVVVALAGPVGVPAASEQTRGHSGLVLSVNAPARTLVVRELVQGGKSKEVTVRVRPTTRIVVSERIPEAEIKDFAQAFRDIPIEVGDLRAGDYVVIESTREKDAEIARQVIVTLRGGGR